MEANIPIETMIYYDHPFPEGTCLLTDAKTVLDYLREYAKDVEHLVEFRKQVYQVRLVFSKCWLVKVLNLERDGGEQKRLDAVLVATGRYQKPYIPDIPGLKEWRSIWPDSVMHSVDYRSSKPYENKALHSSFSCSKNLLTLLRKQY